ncbi:hypothetical protein C8T65DRAFT_665017 [Cerioporus squamosus]|nr:hypothetical protein C8T65DRAFT_665017 [Cerioporus squamosus]
MARQSKKKVFVDNKDAAIDLARSVSDVVEEKAQTKIKMHHSKASAGAIPDHQRPSSSKSRGRLERAKAAVAAQAARAKREKAKERKKARMAPGQSRQTESANGTQTESGERPPDKESAKPRKRVTFG